MRVLRYAISSASSLWSGDVLFKVLTTVVKEIVENCLNLGVGRLDVVVDGGKEFIKYHMDLWAHMVCC